MGANAEYVKYLDEVKAKLDTILSACWNEDRWIRGYKEDGTVIGQRTDPERLFIERLFAFFYRWRWSFRPCDNFVMDRPGGNGCRLFLLIKEPSIFI